jgi:hypothetical protein
LYFHVIAREDLNTGEYTVALETSDDEAFGTADTLLSVTLGAADVNAGWYTRMPTGAKKYLRVTTAASGTTTGMVDKFLSPSVQDQRAVEA